MSCEKGQIVCVKKSICELMSIFRPFMKSFLMYAGM